MTDWYSQGLKELYEEASDATDLSENDVMAVYSFLSEIGLIDYDIEKEVIWDRYNGGDDDAIE